MAGTRNLGIPVYEAGEANEDGVYEATEVGRERSRFGRGPTFVPSGPEPEQAAPSGSQPPPRSTPDSERRRAQREAEREQKRDRERSQREADAAQAHLQAEARQGNEGARLTLDSRAAGAALLQKLRDSGITKADQKPAQQRQRLTGMQRAFGGLMVISCLEPLRGGMRKETVAQTVGMGAMLWMLSPTFRQQVGDQLSSVKSAVTKHIEQRPVRKWGEKAHEQEDALIAQGLDRESMTPEWRTRLEQVEFVERGGRHPFTAHSAALAEVGLAENAYREMREPGADVTGVMRSHRSAVNELYAMGAQDGLDREEISRHMRLIVGSRLDHDPKLATVFEDMGQGRYVKDEPTLVTGPDGRAQQVWTGEFVDLWDNSTITSGSFAPRRPTDAVDHQIEMSDTMMADMLRTVNPNGKVDDINAVITDYAVGVQTATSPDVVDYVEDPSSARRLNRSRQMFQSMADDGIPLADARLAYAGAYVDALSAMSSRYPRFGEQWAAKYGEDWKQTIQDNLQQFGAFGDDLRAQQQQREEQAEAFSAEDEAEDRQERPAAGFASTADGWTDAPRAYGDPKDTGIEDAVEVEGDFDPVIWRGREPKDLFDQMGRHFASQVADPGSSVDTERFFQRYAIVDTRPGTEGRRAEFLDAIGTDFPEQVERVEQTGRMRVAVRAVGVPDDEADRFIAGAFVQGLERTARRETVVEDQLREDVQLIERGNPDQWQEHVFADVLRRDEDGVRESGPGYRDTLTKHGVDPDRYRTDAASPADGEGDLSAEQDAPTAPASSSRRKLWSWKRPDQSASTTHRARRSRIAQAHSIHDEKADPALAGAMPDDGPRWADEPQLT